MHGANMKVILKLLKQIDLYEIITYNTRGFKILYFNLAVPVSIHPDYIQKHS